MTTTTIAQLNYQLLNKIGMFDNNHILGELFLKEGIIKYNFLSITEAGESLVSIHTDGGSSIRLTVCHTEHVAHVSLVSDANIMPQVNTEKLCQSSIDVIAFHLLSSISSNNFIMVADNPSFAQCA